MDKMKAITDIDLSPFEKREGPFAVKYGLPQEVRFCKRCVMSNQRNIANVEYKHTVHSKKKTMVFDEDGICDGCRFADMKKQIDWGKREKELVELCDRHRKSDGSFDCLVPGSGGKDSIYVSHQLKYKYGMHPLTITWAPHIYTDWGWKNLQAWVHVGFDNVLYTPNGKMHRLLTRLAVENLLHPFQPFIFGQKFIAPKMAIKFNIPLIFYGEHPSEYGSLIDNISPAMSNKFFCIEDKDQIWLGGVLVTDIMKHFGVDKNDLEPYMPLCEDELNKKNIKMHYFSYYHKWHPQKNYYYSVENTGFIPSPQRTAGTYSKCNSIDDKIDDFHYYTTFMKFGIGRATYDTSQEVRSGDITREEGVALIKRFDGEFPERFADEIFQYLSINPGEFPAASPMFEEPLMNRDYFNHLCDRFRSPHIWKYENDKWQLRYKVWDDTGGSSVRQEEEAIAWKGNKHALP